MRERNQMRKTLSIILTALLLTVLVACDEEDNDDELAVLEVNFDVPENADVDETITLEALVTYGEEKVTDADEVVFEVWEQGHEDDSEMIDAVNHEDGTYTAEVTFDEDGIFEMYAHTTARDMHTMPKKEIIVGEGGNYEDVNHEESFDTEGFDMQFTDLDNPTVGEDVELTVDLLMNDDPFEEAHVQYEIWHEDDSDDREWLDAEESEAGQYISTYTFTESGTYNMIIHVEDDDLHEHAEYTIDVQD